ncbi:putative inorganic carbon transporter subunit DabA [Sulfitobacter sp.]|uniref:putative inorganic carbon transporter subunit DabA n=1 Tax=Sulfitobacter sp. TaxID=1903071 RepID=UPI0030011219
MLIRNQDFSRNLLELIAATEQAIRKIAPLFPLSRVEAVNPFDGLSDDPIALAAARLERSAGARLFPSRSAQLDRVLKGEITLQDIRISRSEIAPTFDLSEHEILKAVHSANDMLQAISTVADLAAEHSGTDWPNFVGERIGAWAQSHFGSDELLWAQQTNQSAWNSWRDWAMTDRTPEIFDLTGFRDAISISRHDHWEAIGDACAALGIDSDAAPSVFHRLLCDLGGWAGLGRYRLWEADRTQTRDTTLSELLAIRLTWEQAIHTRYVKNVGLKWDALVLMHQKPLQVGTNHLIDAMLQRAAELASARRLDTLLRQAGDAGQPIEPASCKAQLVFCMDVRSERLRRAIEIIEPEIQTYGTAGFSNLPLVSQPSGVGASEVVYTQDRLQRVISRFSRAAVSSFAYVEAAGLLRLGPLVNSSQFHERCIIGYGRAPELALDPTSEAAADAAEAALRSIGMTRDFPPVVVLIGHEARVTNDAQSSLLQCGACGGHDGAMNARTLSCLLNETPLRKLLVLRGIEIPSKTVFQAGLHDTTGDTVTLFITDPVGDRTPQSMRWLHDILDQACVQVRAERSTDLPVTARGGDLYARGGDWSQTRPERGLAGCHWFVAAPRSATRNRDLEGKVFLHDYKFAHDPEGKLLAEIVGGPLLVAARINLQYYGATVAPQDFGSGNKLVQNVCGGIGVLDGTSGRLRSGLSDQSLFLNGKPVHDPLRLIARIAAPQAAIDAAICTSPEVESLVQAGWLEVGSFDQTQVSGIGNC